MNRSKLTIAALLIAAGTTLHAQMPRDNDAWKGRCTALAAVTDLNHLTPPTRALTHGVSADKFTTFAFDRSNANQPAVACTLFFLGAIAAQNANDASAAQSNLTLAGIEIKTAHHQDTSWSESMTKMKAKAHEISKPALTAAEEEAMLAAATTIPVSQLTATTTATNGSHRGF